MLENRNARGPIAAFAQERSLRGLAFYRCGGVFLRGVAARARQVGGVVTATGAAFKAFYRSLFWGVFHRRVHSSLLWAAARARQHAHGRLGEWSPLPGGAAFKAFYRFLVGGVFHRRVHSSLLWAAARARQVREWSRATAKTGHRCIQVCSGLRHAGARGGQPGRAPARALHNYLSY